MSERKTRVLFLSTANAARSQMAEAFLRHYAGDYYEVHSAGLEPRDITPEVAQAMAEVGVPLDGQRAKGVGEYLGQVHFGWLITVCSHAEAHCPTAFLGISKRAYWGDVDDPLKFEGSAEQRAEHARAVRDAINGRVQSWLLEQGE